MPLLLLRLVGLLLVLLSGTITAAAALGRQLPRPPVVPFVLARAGITDIHLLDIQRALLLNWSKSPAQERSPALSPDGQTLTWSEPLPENSLVYIAPLTGGQARLLTPAEAAPGLFQTAAVWSPDGRELMVVASGGRYGPGLQVVRTPLMGGAGHVVGRGKTPAWSPDGRTLLLGELTRSSSTDLMAVDLTCAPDCPSQPFKQQSGVHIEYWPSWSPSGRWIAFGIVFVLDFPAPMRSLYIAPSDCIGEAGAACVLDNPRQVWLPPGWQPLYGPITWLEGEERLLFIGQTHTNAFGVFTQHIDCVELGPGCAPQRLLLFDRWLPVGG